MKVIYLILRVSLFLKYPMGLLVTEEPNKLYVFNLKKLACITLMSKIE